MSFHAVTLVYFSNFKSSAGGKYNFSPSCRHNMYPGTQALALVSDGVEKLGAPTLVKNSIVYQFNQMRIRWGAVIPLVNILGDG